MPSSLPPDLPAAFGLSAPPLDARRHGRGLIHASWHASYAVPGGRRHCLHQGINTRVFSRPGQVMENIQRVTDHLARLAPRPFPRVLEIIPTAQGELLWYDGQGQPWRSYVFIEQAASIGNTSDPDLARRAAGAFGGFITALHGLSPGSLHITLPHFHDTPRRWRQCMDAADRAPPERLRRARQALETARRWQALADLLTPAIHAGHLPLRTVHNDTKIDNLLFSEDDGTLLSVVDLDTVMPGYAVHDFGDMARNVFARGGFSLALFDALLEGFLDGTGTLLLPVEVELLVPAVKLMAFELGLRFLADFLQGDVYFSAEYPRHNLERCLGQFALLETLNRHTADMEACLTKQVKPR